jgi:hypothetical protein
MAQGKTTDGVTLGVPGWIVLRLRAYRELGALVASLEGGRGDEREPGDTFGRTRYEVASARLDGERAVLFGWLLEETEGL